MKNLKIVIISMVIIVVSSCFFDKKPKGVDPFYVIKNYGQFPLLPLSKPVVLYYDKMDNVWSIDMLDYNFNHLLGIQNQKKIGVDKTYIYGNLQGGKIKKNKYQKGDYIYAHKYGGTSTSKEPYKSNDDIRIYSIDSSSKTFLLPERWFVLNVVDSTAEAFFSKKKYEDYLKEKGISGKMYDINKSHKQFKETGILPWFPDSIKVKLKK